MVGICTSTTQFTKHPPQWKPWAKFVSSHVDINGHAEFSILINHNSWCWTKIHLPKSQHWQSHYTTIIHIGASYRSHWYIYTISFYVMCWLWLCRIPIQDIYLDLIQCPRTVGHNWSRSECFQVQPVTCWHLSVFFFIKLGYIPWNTPKWSVIVPKSRTSTGYFSNSSGSSVTSSSRFSPFIDLICPFCRHSCTIHRYAMHSLFDFKKGGLQKYAPMRALSC